MYHDGSVPIHVPLQPYCIYIYGSENVKANFESFLKVELNVTGLTKLAQMENKSKRDFTT